MKIDKVTLCKTVLLLVSTMVMVTYGDVLTGNNNDSPFKLKFVITGGSTCQNIVSVSAVNTYTTADINCIDTNNGEITLKINEVTGIYTMTLNPAKSGSTAKLILTPYMDSTKNILPPTSGGSFSIFGSFWKDTPLRNYSKIVGMAIGDQPTTRITVVDNTQWDKIILTAPTGTGPFSVVFPTLIVTNYNMTFQPPIITSNKISNSQIALTGKNFGAVLDKISLKANSVDIDVVQISVPHTELLISNNYTQSQKIQLDVTVDSIGNTSPYSLYIRPLLKSVTSAPSKGGLITITGQYLNCQRSDGSASTVEISVVTSSSTVQCTNPTNPVQGDYTVLVCQLGSGIGDDLPLKVTIDSVTQDTSSVVLFTYGVPIIKSAETLSNGQILIHGESLGSDASSIVKFNDQQFSNAIAAGTLTVTAGFDQLTVKLPKNSQNGIIQVQVGKKISNQYNMSFKPLVTSCTKSPTEGGIVTVTGSYLSLFSFAKEPLSLVLSGDNPPIGLQSCQQDPNQTGYQLLCTSTPGTGLNNNVQITISSLSSEKFLLSYLEPHISESKQLVAYGLLNGSNFGQISSKAQLFYKKSLFSGSYSVDHHEVKFEIPPTEQPGTTVQVSLNVDGQVSNEMSFQIQPSVGGFSQVDTKGGPITINGAFFYYSRDISVQIGNNSCQSPTVIGSNRRQIACTLPAGSGKDIPISIKLDGTETQNPNNVSYAFTAPIIESYSCTPSCNNVNSTVYIRGKSLVSDNKTSIQIGKRDCIYVYNDLKFYDYVSCFLSFEADEQEKLIKIYPLNITVDGQSFIYPNFTYTYIKYVNPKPQGSVSWMIPAIVVPSFVGLLAITIALFILIRKHRRMKEIKKLFES
ncbi:IPT/TIG domain-containing protein [Tieghemostelium lacteum]|uniref:IPT/TIG domain-containing protein n=1 Tax=Tieghemostelium lacteum TaxID=361077 RepID=A0A151ZHH9_TIELA|nr:IPT/TIG domain-containing protein [Tieghemostelium lacteum]|eukprot:KYQ93377.1 IPT/TIG domain-containing protein [Tieghemostelium lacteum]